MERDWGREKLRGEGLEEGGSERRGTGGGRWRVE